MIQRNVYGTSPYEQDENGCTPTMCRCVGKTLIDRAVAIRQYMRPEDVGHLIRFVPRKDLPPGYHTACNLARGLRSRFASGTLRYIDDPPGCDRWGRPAETLRRGGGDCDDLAIFAASMFRAARVPVAVVIGRMCNRDGCGGHAWVEGVDEAGPFVIEATNGAIWRKLPAGYERHYFLTPEEGRVAPGYLSPEALPTIVAVNAAVIFLRQIRRAA